jgi:Leucine-rich repeat (LRR) protein
MISQIHVLKLNFNQIKRIESYAFAGLGNLTSLGLGSQSLFYIETNAFDGLTELRHLDLSQSVNLIFADNAFGRYSLENLDTLDLSYCNLSTLPDRLFQALP